MKMNLLLPIFPTLLCCFYTTETARILGVFPIPSYSHYTLGSKLLKKLAARGHDVTMISPYPQKSLLKNFRDIELSGFVEAFEEKRKHLFKEDNVNFIMAEITLNSRLFKLTEEIFKKNSVQKLLNSDEEFDLVILEEFMTYAVNGFCYRFKAPCISFSAIGLSRMNNEQVANPLSPSYIPDFGLHYGSNMKFFERIHNSFTYLFAKLYKHLYVFPQHNRIIRKYFPGAPDISDLHYNTSLAFVNAHVSTNPAVPYVPNMIDIGGFHVKSSKPLPSELQEYLDNAKEGAILFSMGSNLRSSELPVEKREVILKAFARLKQKVLWKWEDEYLPGKPANVKIEKWLPQSDVLAHLNVKLFVTHGGLLSTIEAVHHGVPIVAIPIFGDQKLNLANAVSSGIGLGLPYSKLTQETFYTVLEEVLTNPKYSKNAKRRAKIMHDQPIKPLEKAVYWVEYVIRHKGAPHLRSAELKLHWYQYLLLDVLVFCIVTTLIGIAIIYWVIRFVLCRSNLQKFTRSKKKN